MEIIINEKGEGMVLRKPEGLYEHGRSKNTVKLKVIIINNNKINIQ